MKNDLILLHAPSVLDLKDRPRIFGPISDVIPSTPLFEMYPVGLLSIAEYLNRFGYKAKVINLALKLVEEPDFDVRRFISRLDCKVFGIDLHWLAHANGSIELAKICKELHPEKKVLFGGISSTYYWKELIGYDVIDFILKGDSTEPSVLKLVQELDKNAPDLESVPNLVFKRGSKVVDNGITYVAEDLDDTLKDLKFVVNMLTSERDLDLYSPNTDFLKNPITMIVTARGCTKNCAICGGSKYFYNKYCNRKRVAFRSPERIIEDLLVMESYGNIPVLIVGDLRQGGNKYWRNVVEGIKKEQIDLPFIFELFNPAPQEYFKGLSGLEDFNLQISPETHSEEIRFLQGKRYTNAAIEKNISYALEAGIKKFDLYFMMGIPGQTKEEIGATLGYFEKLASFGKRVHFFLSPLVPFLDPGSLAFDFPQKYGVRILFKDFESYYNALNSSSWTGFFNYEGVLSREELVFETYDSIARLLEMKREYGYISESEYDQKMRLTSFSRQVCERLEKGEKVEALIDTMDLKAPVSTTKELYWGKRDFYLKEKVKILARQCLSYITNPPLGRRR